MGRAEVVDRGVDYHGQRVGDEVQAPALVEPIRRSRRRPPLRAPPQAASREVMVPRLSLVICTLDEAEAIGSVLAMTVVALSGVDFEIIVVDDSVDERTATEVAAVQRREPRVRLIRRLDGEGLASAAICGWDAARGRVLGVMDGDGQHDPALLSKMLRALDGGEADIAVASRYMGDGESGLRGLRNGLSRCATRLTRPVLGVRAADPMSGFFVMTRAWFEQARPRLSGVGFKVLVDVILSGRRPPRLYETPTSLLARMGGRSKLDMRVCADLFALIAEKRTGGWLPARAFLFALVGASGVAVNLAATGAAHSAMPLERAQAAGIGVAMTSNFFLNNLLTFRDRRLRGAKMLGGLLAFYAACGAGALVNEAVVVLLASRGAYWPLASLLGAFSAMAINYQIVLRGAWREAGGKRRFRDPKLSKDA